MKKYLLILSSIFLCYALNAQDTSIVNYYPTQVGNVWVYQLNAGGMMGSCVSNVRKIITGTVMKYSKTYYLFQTTSRLVSGTTGCTMSGFDTVRVDPITGNILRFTELATCYLPHENVIDSMRSKIFDILKSCGYGVQMCTDTSIITLFGLNKQRKSFGISSPQGGTSWSYVKGFGYCDYDAWGSTSSAHLRIRGCVMNGVVYGDTSYPIGITQISSEVPERFELYQNYPNPFNPTTKIVFQIPLLRGVDAEGRRGVLLAVYDVLGREVATLVNALLSPGTYETEFDGTNYPSGVYFYVFESGEFRQTKNMVLIK